jgi:hypothetical protein
MAKADIVLRGRNYSIACAPGQEARIVALSQQLDARVKHIASAVGDIGEDRLLLITALALLDELDAARRPAGPPLPRNRRQPRPWRRCPSGSKRLPPGWNPAAEARQAGRDAFAPVARGSPAYVRVITRPERRHDMQMLITILFYAALAALLVVLGLGIANLARTDENQPSRSNKLMRMRVFIQAIAIALLVGIGFMAGAIHF